MGQWETHIQGYPIRIDTRLQSRAWDDCPPLEKGPNVKEIKCNNSTCVMKCMPGFVKVSFFLHRNPRKFWLRIFPSFRGSCQRLRILLKLIFLGIDPTTLKWRMTVFVWNLRLWVRTNYDLLHLTVTIRIICQIIRQKNHQ